MTTKVYLAIVILLACSPAIARDTLTTVAMTIYGEAAGESYAGKYAVAEVIFNRAHGQPAKLKSVCLSRKQFSCWRNRRFTQQLPDLRKPLDRIAWTDCVALAGRLSDGSFRPDTKATHYHRFDISPKWNQGMTMVASVGQHEFYATTR